MDTLPIGKLSPIAHLRVLVAHLGEKAPSLNPPWWPTQFTTEAGLEFSRQNFPRSWVSAAVNGATRAAREVHDERIGRTGTTHLFRFDGGLEREVHQEILHADQSALAELIGSADLALEQLERLADEADAETESERMSELDSSPPAGPVQVGVRGEELSRQVVARIAALYLDGIRRNEPVFPYLADPQNGASANHGGHGPAHASANHAPPGNSAPSDNSAPRAAHGASQHPADHTTLGAAQPDRGGEA